VGVDAAGGRTPLVACAGEVVAEQPAVAVFPREQVGLGEREGDGVDVLGFEKVYGLQARGGLHAADISLS